MRDSRDCGGHVEVLYTFQLHSMIVTALTMLFDQAMMPFPVQPTPYEL